jgi:hypothetical protein
MVLLFLVLKTNQAYQIKSSKVQGHAKKAAALLMAAAFVSGGS